MSYRKIGRVMGIFLCLASLMMLLWAIWPPVFTERVVPFKQSAGVHQSAERLSVSDRESANNDEQNGILIMRWPSRVRVGDRGLILLNISDSGELGENSFIEGRLEISGMPAIPYGEVYETYRSGEQAAFFWNVQPEQAGIFDGFIWLHQSKMANDDSISSPLTATGRTLITAQRVHIQAIELFGLSGPAARLMGALGVVLGIIFLLEDILSGLFKPAAKESRA